MVSQIKDCLSTKEKLYYKIIVQLSKEGEKAAKEEFDKPEETEEEEEEDDEEEVISHHTFELFFLSVVLLSECHAFPFCERTQNPSK